MRRIAAFVAWMVLACPAAAEEIAATVARAGSSETIPATIIKPDGAGPFPAVVMVHDCSGLGPRSSGAPRRWAEFLRVRGYVSILPDSFTTRGFPGGVCTAPNGSGLAVNPGFRAVDVLGALAALKALPYVDGRRIVVMGGSHGGSTTLATLARGGGFAAGIALYPACRYRYGTWHPRIVDHRLAGFEGVYRPEAPLLILVGALDDWTPAAHCEALAAASRAAGLPVELRVFANAQHSFDSAAPQRFVAARNNINAPSGHGATTGGNAEAWAAARREVEGFLARTLAAR